MSLPKILKNHLGQSLTEAALTAPLIIFFAVGLVWFAKVCLTWQQLVMGCRFGVDLITNTDQSKENIKNQIYNFLCSKSTIGRTLNKDNLTVNIELQDCKEINFKLDISNLINNITEVEKIVSTFKNQAAYFDNSSVELEYKYDLPKIFNLVNKKDVTLRYKLDCLSGTGMIGWKRK